MERTQEEKILSGIAHIAVLFSWLGLVLNVILFAVYKPKSRFVAGHAKQALGLWLVQAIIRSVVGLITGGSVLAAMYNPFRTGYPAGFGLAVLGGLLSAALGIAVLVLVILACIKGFNGDEHRYPVIGEFVARIGE